MYNKEVNQVLIKFWDSAMNLSKEDIDEINASSVGEAIELAPSPKLAEAVKELGQCHHVLDYGCGSGWAAIIASKSGAKQVDAVDLGENIIETVKVYVRKYQPCSVNAQTINADWLKNVPNDTYDGFISSNVLDVVPLETAQEIIKETARVVVKDAKVIIGLNFFMDEEAAKKRNIELIEGKYLIMNGVLRLTSLSDEEWTKMFSPYFKVIKLDYFAWPNEPRETRRLFILKRI